MPLMLSIIDLSVSKTSYFRVLFACRQMVAKGAFKWPLWGILRGLRLA